MTRLANISYTSCINKLKMLGFDKVREAKGSHELRIHKDTKKKVVVPRHNSRDMKIGTIRAILRQGEINLDDFLNS